MTTGKTAKPLGDVFSCALYDIGSLKGASSRERLRRVAREMRHGNGLHLPRRCKIGGLDAVHCRWYIDWRCEFPSATKLPRNAPTARRPVCAPARRYGHRSGGKTVGKLQ